MSTTTASTSLRIAHRRYRLACDEESAALSARRRASTPAEYALQQERVEAARREVSEADAVCVRLARECAA